MSRFTLQVGNTVQINKSGLIGRVRFVGKTYFKTGEWVGIELDSLQVIHSRKPSGDGDGWLEDGGATPPPLPSSVPPSSTSFSGKGKMYEFDERARQWSQPVIGTLNLYFNRRSKKMQLVMWGEGSVPLEEEDFDVAKAAVRYDVLNVTNMKPSQGNEKRAWVFNGRFLSGADYFDKVHALKFDRAMEASAFKRAVDAAVTFERQRPKVEAKEDEDATSAVKRDRARRRLTMTMASGGAAAATATAATGSDVHTDSPSRRLTVTVNSAPTHHQDEKSSGIDDESSLYTPPPPRPSPTSGTAALLRKFSIGSEGSDIPAPSPLLPPGVQSGKSGIELKESVKELLKKKSNKPSWLEPRRVAVRCIKGYSPDPSHKPFNQDAKVIEQDDVTGAWLFCVFDGHGADGHHVSHFFSTRIAHAVFEHEHWPSHPGVAIKDCVLKLESELLRNCKRSSSTVDCGLSGTTAVMAAVHLGKVTVANIGDSRIIAGVRSTGGRIRGIDVSNDHKPDLPKEKARIERNGGRVFAIEYDDGGPSPARVWLKDKMLPGLAMSRSLGDAVAKTAGVISQPEITERELKIGEDEFLVLGSDGLYEFIESQEVAEMVDRAESLESAAETLFRQSKKLWLENEPVSDDTTIIVVELGASRD
eukprot:g3062.t1